MSASLLSIQKLDYPSKFPAYMVFSTAPYNVEDASLEILDPITQKIPSSPQRYLDEMTAHLKEYKENAEILIVIHGYNTSMSGVKAWFETIGEHIDTHCKSLPEGFILIGYRWPSEQIISSEPSQPGSKKSTWSALQNKWKASKTVLPFILGKALHWGRIGFFVGAASSVVGLVAMALQVPGAGLVLVLGSGLIMASLIATAPIFTVLLLRLVGYFRDNYRASYYGVPDLVELIRQIDAGLVGSHGEAGQDSSKIDWNQNRIKLSFIGHSMGGFVVTNAVRILSDVFDSDSIGTLDATNPHKDPSSKIGNVFCLGRLVLASPDIPAETIISGRSNFLKSSLRRFEEAYLFSNEGDMALRLASTAANYFSFPTRTQDGGYRLGNVTVRSSPPGTNQDDQETYEDYGIVVRLPNEVLVKLESYAGAFGSPLGAKLALIKDGQPVNLQGQPLDNLPTQELIWPQAGDLESLQDGQIVRLQTGQMVSLQTKGNGEKKIWCFVELQEGNLCRIQPRTLRDDLFILKEDQFIKLAYGRIAKIKHGAIEILKDGQTVQALGQVFKVEKGQLFEFKHGFLSEVNEPLQFVQDDQLTMFQAGEFVRFQDKKDGEALSNPQAIQVGESIAILFSFPLDYLYIREKTALSKRQGSIALAPNETPIGELFTFFDCTDYVEPGLDQKPLGVLSHAKRKKALGFEDYFPLTKDYFGGKIDTHGGYFNCYDPSQPTKPEATFSKLMIYGLACLGFETFLTDLMEQGFLAADHDGRNLQALYSQLLDELETHCPGLSESQRTRIASTQVLSSLCQKKQVQVLLSKKCYAENVLGIEEKPQS